VHLKLVASAALLLFAKFAGIGISISMDFQQLSEFKRGIFCSDYAGGTAGGLQFFYKCFEGVGRSGFFRADYNCFRFCEVRKFCRAFDVG
jgi:hypothetical protein